MHNLFCISNASPKFLTILQWFCGIDSGIGLSKIRLGTFTDKPTSIPNANASTHVPDAVEKSQHYSLRISIISLIQI